MILGDNIFYGHDLAETLQAVNARHGHATIFGYRVSNPQAYGVVQFDAEGRVVGLEEKPDKPKSHFAVPGLYFYENDVVEIAKALRPSARNELEITDVNLAYLERGKLQVELLGRGTAWLDTGTPESLLAAAQFIETIEQRQGLKIACPEEIAYRMKLIDRTDVLGLASELQGNNYGRYLERMVEE